MAAEQSGEGSAKGSKNPSRPKMEAKDRLIFALDLPNREEADAFAAKVDSHLKWFKIGLELFSAEGPGIVRDYAEQGRHVFLDLKLHDIPATVGRAVTRLSELGAKLLTVHAGGSRAMMEAACEAAAQANCGTEILAVTALTSLDENDLRLVGIQTSLEEVVLQRAQLAAQSGCNGVVASAWEAGRLRKLLPKDSDFSIVTPGIRLGGQDAGDQKRVMGPGEAVAAGADRIVVGRPIRDAEDPVAAVQTILKELEA